MDSSPKIGVFLCTCGHMMNDYFDTRALLASAAKEPGVSSVDEGGFLCTKSGLEWLKIKIARSGCERVVIAGCSPHQHELKFRQAIEEAGLNRSLMTIANLREGCVWVCRDKKECLPKAERMLKAAIHRVALAKPVDMVQARMSSSALIIGAGESGVRIALELHRLGIQPLVIDSQPRPEGEREAFLPTPCTLLGTGGSGSGQDIGGQRHDFSALLKELSHKKIELLTSTEVREVAGGVGAFRVVLDTQGRERLVEVGSIVVASGSRLEDGANLAKLGSYSRIVSLGRLQKMIEAEPERLERMMITAERRAKHVCFILGGPRGEKSLLAPFVKRASIMALNQAILLRRRFKAEVAIVASDIIVCGAGLEDLYRLARQSGVLFFRTPESRPPQVSLEKGVIKIRVYDSALADCIRESASGEDDGGYPVLIQADLLALEDEVLPSLGTETLQSILRVDLAGISSFYQGNIHLKPNLSNRRGVFVVGSCHGVEDGGEMLSDIRSVAMAVFSLLSRPNLAVEQKVVINTDKCALCLTCIRTCPHRAIEFGEVKAGQKWGARVIPQACQGCGICAGECPAKAIEMVQYSDDQIFSELTL